ncbi:MAG: alpha/beta fold hydrolase, partial [Anaerolineae bacterium]|nr:alpha/beta fold hydrolase [Anaerolineae bacterium]
HQPTNAKKRRLPIGRILLAIYLVALAASTVARINRTDPPTPPRFNEKTALVRAIQHDQTNERQIKLAYLDYVPPNAPNAPVVVMLHGSPGSGSNFNRVAPILSGNCPPPGSGGDGFNRAPIKCPDTPPAQPYRIIAPDLPGFGNSEINIPDYSFRAHAFYLRQLLDQLGIEKVHFVGYSMGGGPALNFYDLAPQRVKSITMLSSLGAQEFELTGDYYLNHLIHGLQTAFFWGLQQFAPHFGAFDRASGVPFSLNFYQSDQRPLRDYMNRFEPPFLIIQGQQDGQVPPEAALEHYRIVPHSELVMTEAGHGMVFSEPELVTNALAPFLNRVERGQAPTRAQATASRSAAASQPVHMSKMIGIATAAFVILLGVTALLSDELACVAAGLMVLQQRIDFLPAMLACLVGMFIGNLVVHRLGRSLPHDAAQRLPWRWLIGPQALARSHAAFQQRPFRATLISRLAPAWHSPIALATGAYGVRTIKFAAYFLITALIWVPLLVGASALIGGNLATRWFEHNTLLAILTAFAIMWLLLRGVWQLLWLRLR